VTSPWFFKVMRCIPQMNVAQNIGFALKMEEGSEGGNREEVKSAANVLGISDWLDRKPSQLSGGQRQRVAMGRAIVREPNVFLMDEPLSNLDAKLRVQIARGNSPGSKSELAWRRCTSPTIKLKR